MGEQANLRHKLRCCEKGVTIFSGRKGVLPVGCLSPNGGPVPRLGCRTFKGISAVLRGPTWPAGAYWTDEGEFPFCGFPLASTFDPSLVPFQILLFKVAAPTAGGVWPTHSQRWVPHLKMRTFQAKNVSDLVPQAFMGSFRTVLQPAPSTPNKASCSRHRHPVYLGQSRPRQTNCTQIDFTLIFAAQANGECKPHWPRKVGEIASECRKKKKKRKEDVESQEVRKWALFI